MARYSNSNNSQQPSRQKGSGDWEINDFIGRSAAARDVREQLEWLANEPDATIILITGESGVGKDLAAKILQSVSVNVTDKKSFVHLNCGALENEHVHSELFGHRKDSYTDGHYERLGCFRAAEDGALFLNEIGNISLNIQSRLLHVLDDNKVKPLGLDNEIEVKSLLIFATNADLVQMVEQGLFRNDLLQRIQCYQIYIPPLRERQEDIPLIADFLYRIICLKSKRGIKPVINKEVYSLLAGCQLNGNARELENMLRAAYCCMTRKHEVVLRPSHFCINSQKTGINNNDVVLTGEGLSENFKQKLRLYIRQKQKLNQNEPDNKNTPYFDFPKFSQDIETIFLQENGGNKSRAAIRMNIKRKQFYRKKPGKQT